MCVALRAAVSVRAVAVYTHICEGECACVCARKRVRNTECGRQRVCHLGRSFRVSGSGREPRWAPTWMLSGVGNAASGSTKLRRVIANGCPQTPRRCPARDPGLGPGPDASTPPASTGTRALPRAFGECTRLRREGCPRQTTRTSPSQPSECCAPAAPSIALGGGGSVSSARPTHPSRGLGRTPPPLQREALTTSSGT